MSKGKTLTVKELIKKLFDGEHKLEFSDSKLFCEALQTKFKEIRQDERQKWQSAVALLKKSM